MCIFFSDIRLTKMISYLSPAFLRVGGNQADQIFFQKGDLSDLDGLSNNETDIFYLTGNSVIYLDNYCLISHRMICPMLLSLINYIF